MFFIPLGIGIGSSGLFTPLGTRRGSSGTPLVGSSGPLTPLGSTPLGSCGLFDPIGCSGLPLVLGRGREKCLISYARLPSCLIGN